MVARFIQDLMRMSMEREAQNPFDHKLFELGIS